MKQNVGCKTSPTQLSIEENNSMLLLLIIVVLLFSGGGYYGYYNQWSYHRGLGIGGVIALLLLLYLLFGNAGIYIRR